MSWTLESSSANAFLSIVLILFDMRANYLCSSYPLTLPSRHRREYLVSGFLSNLLTNMLKYIVSVV